MATTTHPPTGPDTMPALVQRSWRGPEDLALNRDHPRPEPEPGGYLVRVGAAGVNFADVLRARGSYAGGPRPPFVAGFEAAGEIVAVGPGVNAPLPVGSPVIGAGPGAFARYMTMPAAEALPVPPGWTAAQALGLVLNGATALAALRPLGELAAGETVLIHAAAGGVGQTAVRLARHLGARVVATASPAKHAAVRALGVEHVLDPRRPDLAEEIRRLTGGVDLVLESVGRTTFAASLAAARPVTGRVVVFGAASGDAHLTTHDLVFTHPVRVQGLHIGTLAREAPATYRALLAELRALVDRGVYPPGTPEVHPLAEGPAVLRELAAGTTRGKHALDPWR
ncbi:zinc-binding dehydrogenase [Streptomyces sp. 3MP-14]|uniref:Zinc-binding dehydrogenase n=1 Tax=Streptomyces mimosae TaxID=2586635 RepID=A0A5N6A070_9ACTN|nr:MULTISPECIES: NADPH:quinone oxidoreductase family protein [Streptomyces]KAB8162147.1 zinc-binding dehydrogenase [Streptomyces mimosae]KAB8173955.1 zinc-binding dehydrogenase [Streptomyces sp. 3MP-14]